MFVVLQAAISLSTSTAATQNFDAIGALAVATLPADFKVDRTTSSTAADVRKVGTYAAALTATALLGGANLGTGASNGIYNFGAGTTTGGPDRAIGWLASGTATASGNLYAQFTNNTGGPLTGLQIGYNVEKYRNGSNAAGFRIQLFYSTDGSTWTSAGPDFLTSFPADANNNGFANAPGTTVNVSKTLPVPIASNSLFYLAWNYSVSTGTTVTNAQALAIDDISVLGLGNTSTNPGGTGTPATVRAGNSTVLTVTVTPGTNPLSSGLGVSADLTQIGGSATQAFFDDGTHGDVTAGDNVFSFNAAVPSNNATGSLPLPFTVTDAQNRSGSGTINVTVTSPSTPLTAVGATSPASLQAGNSFLLTAAVSPGTNPTSTGITVTADLSNVGGSATQQLFDDGTHGDVAAGDNTFSMLVAVPGSVTAGVKSLALSVKDSQARTATANASVTIQPPPPPTTIKISQVYGGGGNSGATYRNDFIELFNQGSTPIDLTGWSVQYHSAGTDTTPWQVTPLCASQPCAIQPHRYMLIAELAGTGGTTALPAADVSGSINMSSSNGKVALVASTTPLAGTPVGSVCDTSGAVADVLGYGSAGCFEGSAAPSLTNTTAAVRRGNGCTDTDTNSADFVAIGPIPRNSGSPANSCGGDPSQPFGLGLASPSSLDPASNVLLSVKVTPATTPPSTGITVTADLTSIGGVANQAFLDNGTNGDVTAGDNTFSFLATVGAFMPTGAASMVATVSDAEGRSVTAPITITITSPTCGVERWSVKTGTDPDASSVDLSKQVPATILDLGNIPPPADPPGPPLNARFDDNEKTVFVVNATLTLYKRETDVDYHIVLQDDAGHTMISEIPSPACVGAGSPFAAGIAAARKKFDSRFNASTFFTTDSVPVRIAGVGFFDFKHGQTGVAPNGIELHPVLEIDFTANTTTTLSSSLNPSAFGQTVSLTADVSTGTAVVPTGNVTFLDAGNKIGAAPLDASGRATFTTSDLAVASHAITASYEGDTASAPSTSAPLTQIVQKADQSITFTAPDNRTFGDADFTLSASASSGLTVSFSVTAGPATVAGNTVHLNGAGTVTLRASQGGDSNYNAAPDIDRTFTVAKAAQTITFAPLNDKTYGDPPFTVSATFAGSNNPVTFTATGACSAGGTNGSTITITAGGTCTVTASQPGDDNYLDATPVARAFTVDLAKATIVVDGYNDVYDGHAHGATGTAKGVAGEDLSRLLSFGQSFKDVPGGTAHWTFAGDGNYKPASGTVTITITKATPAFSNLSSPSIEAGTPATTIGGTVSLGPLVPMGSVSITLAGSTQSAAVGPNGQFAATFATGGLPPSATAYAIAFTYGGDGNFNGATAIGSFRVGDTTPPVISGVAASPDTLGPPNHDMIDVTVAYQASADLTGAPSCGLSVASNEPVNGTGDGNTATDWTVIDPHHVQLRAERAGTGTDRVYTITVTCADPSGNRSTSAASVRVPK